MHGLKLAEVELNRKSLSELAISSPEAFANIVETAKKALETRTTEDQVTDTKIGAGILDR